MKQCSYWSAVCSFSCIRSIRSCRWLISMVEDAFAGLEQKSSVMSPNDAVSTEEKSSDTIEMHMWTHCSTCWWTWSVACKEFEHNPREIPAQPHSGLDRLVAMDHLHPRYIKGVCSAASPGTVRSTPMKHALVPPVHRWMFCFRLDRLVVVRIRYEAGTQIQYSEYPFSIQCT